jgi:uncharacterized repeat protein (TIGR01451 family)
MLDRFLSPSPIGPRVSRLTAVLLAGLSSLALATVATAAPPHRTIEAPPEVELPAAAVEGAGAGTAFEHAARTDDGRIQVFVELQDPAAAVVFADAMRGALPSDKRARAAAGAASKAQVLRVQAAQESVAKELTAPAIGAREIYRVSKVLNGIAVAIDPANLRSLQKVHGVKRVLPILMEYPNNSTSVPFLGTPNVWANTLGLPAGADGTGVRIGIIDTGIDYLHPDFGGPGQTATDYMNERTDTANFTTVGTAAIEGPFPTPKVVGGTDFAGDNYTGSNAPVPDANPMDCNGHGSHVSGTAAGFGVKPDGTTFTGPYDANTSTYSPLLIGPGTAPKALLYGIRVFGCFGSTGLTVQGIDWAMDPNGDNDLSDHLDVINMSLGSDFGSITNASSVASDNAALAGVIVVTSTGNSGDTFFIASAPGAGSRVIATAASVDVGVTAGSIRANAPAAIAGTFFTVGTAQFGSSPPTAGLTGNVVQALDPADGSGPLTTDGCSPLTNAAAVAGNIALIDRGTCSFIIKVKNAQNAGAIAVIIANSSSGVFGNMAGVDPTITIPSVMVGFADGNTFKADIPGLNVTLFAGSDTLASFSSHGPRQTLGSPVRLKPDISAPGLNITSVETGIVCTAASTAAGSCTGTSDPSGIQVSTRTLTISGTSMASPHITGIMALLRELKPDWSVEELKALVMNYATHDVTVNPGATPPRYGPSRVGAGRVDPSQSAVGDVIAMNAEDVGLVSVTFEPEVIGVVNQTKKIRVVNKGLTDQTYDLAFDNVVDSPGVTYSLPGGNSVTVPAGQTVELFVQMSANANLMDHTIDPSLSPIQNIQTNYGAQPRNYLTEEGSYLTFSQGAALKFRLPVYMAEKPSSDMSGPATIVTGGAPTGSTTIPLSGTGLCTGTLLAGPTCSGVGTLPKIESLVSPFELQVVSPLDPVHAFDYSDIHYAGTAYFQAGASPSLTNDLLLFGLASWGDWPSLDLVAYDVCVDTNNDGVYEKIVYNATPSIFVSGASLNDNFVRIVLDTATNGNTILGLGSFVNLVSPASFDTSLHLNNTMILGVTPSQLGIASTAVTSIKYKVVTCPGTNPTCARTTTGDHCSPAAGTFFDQAAGPYTYNWAAQGLNFGGDFLDEDLNGNALPVTWNTANMAANGSLGALLLHHFNGVGNRAEVVLLDSAPSADLGLTKTVDNAAPAAGGTVVFTLTVTNHGPNNATGVVVSDPLPDGLTYVSDDGGGAYDSVNTGLWTVGALNNGASATLHITVTADSTDPIENIAEITDGSPLDPNAANNRATVTLQAPRSADLHLTFGANVASVNPGGSILYTLTVKNNGQDPAYSVDVLEAFPSFPSLAPGSFTASQGVYNPATGHWSLASLPVGDTATLSFTVTAPNIAGSLVNNASTSSSKSLVIQPKAADPNPADNSATVTVMVLSPATLSATKSVAGSFVEGGAITYTIIVSNSGSFDQHDNPGHEVTDVLPSQLTLVSASATSGTAVATVGTNTVTWDGSVTAGGSVTITIHATVKAGTALQTVTNTANVAYDANGDGTNEAAANSTAPGGGATSFVVVSPSSIGTHTKTVSGNFSESGTVTYTVVISNPSANTQLDNPGDEFTDVLPTGLTLVSASATSGTATADVPNRTVHWNGSIAAGGSVTITITALVNTGTAGQTISNQGTVFFDADGNGTNESSILTDDPSTAAANDPTSFRVPTVGEIPTLSELGLVALALLLMSGALLMLRRRRA